eukprot:6204424-Pleurochrysis_carterae.AAC.1
MSSASSISGSALPSAATTSSELPPAEYPAMGAARRRREPEVLRCEVVAGVWAAVDWKVAEAATGRFAPPL